MSSSEVGMELLASVRKSTHSVAKMFSLVYLSGCVVERCIFVFDYREANVVLQVNAELISVDWFIIEVFWLFVKQTLDHRISIGVCI